MELPNTSNEHDILYVTIDELKSLLVMFAKKKIVLSVAYESSFLKGYEHKCSNNGTIDYDTVCRELSGEVIPKSPRTITIKIKQE